jgi:hypothetical protein
LNTGHPPYVIPASENHGTWLYYRFAVAGEPATHSFVFTSATTARGVLLAYRGVDTAAPPAHSHLSPSLLRARSGFDRHRMNLQRYMKREKD